VLYSASSSGINLFKGAAVLNLACLWLQTGMRGAFGKPQGVCARVAIGQILLSIRCKDVHNAQSQEALRRAKFKFPGRQKIVVSRNW
jgi:large subunit ribosomal protein L10e